MEKYPPPLDQLSAMCYECLHQTLSRECEACRELAYRALCDGNDAAWDLLVSHLWPFMLHWIYAEVPEVGPMAAEALGYRTLWRFRRQCAAQANLATNFPTFTDLLRRLHRNLLQLLSGGG